MRQCVIHFASIVTFTEVVSMIDVKQPARAASMWETKLGRQEKYID